ncbi:MULTISPECIES: dipeptidase [unclassified Ekhidna]|jgi:membrane dipeptidase|uniref:dipeptidase n=1 Tax=unclassified Ekhidna TaxID=2632188 RepID=UPI0032DFC385
MDFSLRKLSSLLLLSALIIGCTVPEEEKVDYTAMSETELDAVADSLAHAYIIVDGHVDLPYRMNVKGFMITKTVEDVSVETTGNFDYPKAKRGGLDAPFMSIYVPSRYQETGGAKAFADSLIDMVSRLPETFPSKFALADSPADIKVAFEQGLIALPMGMENGAPIEDDINNVKYFYDRGIRYITLTHSKDNQICDSSYDTTYTWNGVSPFGEQVIAEMNKWGIMVDISHVTDSAAFDALRLTKAPVIASHSSCRKFTPGWERNMPDTLIKAMAENGGVIHINFGSSFLSQESQDKFEKMREDLTNYMAENSLSSEDSIYKAYAKQYALDNDVYEDVQKVADHIDHVVSLVGVDYVGLGSDYDGVGDSLPKGLKDVSTYPNLIKELLNRGYSPEDIEKICYKNTFRVWERVQEVANELQSNS